MLYLVTVEFFSQFVTRSRQRTTQEHDNRPSVSSAVSIKSLMESKVCTLKFSAKSTTLPSSVISYNVTVC